MEEEGLGHSTAVDIEPAPPPDLSKGLEFTYAEPSSDQLEQGDLLERTTEIDKQLDHIHPKYKKSENTHFLVITQSCDLVRRDGRRPKARYVTVAAVRPLDRSLERFVRKIAPPDFDWTARLVALSRKGQVEEFLRQVMNNTHPEYFYLAAEHRIGLEESCAVLRLTVPFKIEHYDRFMDARRLSLTPIFQAKLGWLVGNIYSRVGTRDRVGDVEPKKEWQERVREMLDQEFKWVDSKRLNQALKAKNRGDEIPEDPAELVGFINKIEVESRKDRALRRVLELVEDQLQPTTDDLERLEGLLRADPRLDSQLQG